MIELLEQQKKLTANQWKMIGTANLADMLDFFDFFLIGYVLGVHHRRVAADLSAKSAVILLASGLGAVPGAFFWGWMGDRIGRRTVFMATLLNVALATGIMAFTPEQDALDLRLDVSDVLPLLRRLRQRRPDRGGHPAGAGIRPVLQARLGQRADHRRCCRRATCWVRVSGAFLAPIIGWRGLFLVGLLPAALVLMIRYWVPKSPRWLLRMGRHEEARRSLAWALQVDPRRIALPATAPEAEKTLLARTVQVPAQVAAACLHRPEPDRRASGSDVDHDALFVLVLRITPAEASS